MIQSYSSFNSRVAGLILVQVQVRWCDTPICAIHGMVRSVELDLIAGRPG